MMRCHVVTWEMLLRCSNHCVSLSASPCGKIWGCHCWISTEIFLVVLEVVAIVAVALLCVQHARDECGSLCCRHASQLQGQSALVYTAPACCSLVTDWRPPCDLKVVASARSMQSHRVMHVQRGGIHAHQPLHISSLQNGILRHTCPAPS